MPPLTTPRRRSPTRRSSSTSTRLVDCSASVEPRCSSWCGAGSSRRCTSGERSAFATQTSRPTSTHCTDAERSAVSATAASGVLGVERRDPGGEVSGTGDGGASWTVVRTVADPGAHHGLDLGGGRVRLLSSEPSAHDVEAELVHLAGLEESASLRSDTDQCHGSTVRRMPSAMRPVRLDRSVVHALQRPARHVTAFVPREPLEPL